MSCTTLAVTQLLWTFCSTICHWTIKM